MPALPDVAKVVKVALIWSDGQNTDIVTRFYIRYSGSAGTAEALSSFCTDVKGAWDTQFTASTNEAITLGRVHAIDLSSSTGAEGDWLGGVPGTGTDPPNALDVAFVVSYEIARRYRGGHPRAYLPILQSTSLDGPQRWLDAEVTAVHGGIVAFFAAVVAAGWSGAGTLEHVNVSYFEGFTVVTNPTTGRARNVPNVRAVPLVDPVTGYVARSHVGTQRRRLQY